MDIQTIKQVDSTDRNVVLHVSGHSISINANERTKRIARGQKVILLYSDTDGRLVACICGWRMYFLYTPLRFDAYQTDAKPGARQFAGIRKNSLDKMVYRLFRLPQKIMGKRR